MMDINKNDIFLCIRSIPTVTAIGPLRSDSFDGNAFTKGRYYNAPLKGILINNQGNLWKPEGSFDSYKDYFQPASRGVVSNESNSKELDEFQVLVGKMHDTYVRKNHDYGNSFDVSMDEEGLTAARIRLNDKWLRFKQLSKGEEALVKDESIRDTLLDMANYCIMTVMWMDRNKKEDDKACE
jgi:hypothetical protein